MFNGWLFKGVKRVKADKNNFPVCVQEERRRGAEVNVWRRHDSKRDLTHLTSVFLSSSVNTL